MDDLDVVQFVQKTIKERKRNVLDILENNGISSMEQYASLMGEMTSLTHVEQELSSLLEKQERYHD
jgi:hypothetical protein|tara:strand:- start:1069 stop:1266 length:198 start_codon:yes stop_codon:yes gene_type:complete